MTGCYKSTTQKFSAWVSNTNASSTGVNADDDFFKELDAEYGWESGSEPDSGLQASEKSAAIIEEFTAGQFNGWNERVFEGTSSYLPVISEERTVLEATTNASASLLFKRRAIDLTTTPLLEWTWKITDIYPQLASGQIDERSRAGDDFPARVYVVFRDGPLPRDALAINYIWSSKSPTGSSWSNPYQKNAIMMVVESGATRAGQWVTHKRNVAEDFKLLFNKDIRSLDGFAVMVDGDNTGSTTTSWFDKLSFSGSAEHMLK